MSLFIRFEERKGRSKDRIESFKILLDSFNEIFELNKIENILTYKEAPIIDLNEYNKYIKSFDEIYKLIEKNPEARRIGIKLDINSKIGKKEIKIKAHLYPTSFVSRNMKDIIIETENTPLVELLDSNNIKLLKNILDKYNKQEKSIRIAQATLIDEQKYDEDHSEKAKWIDYASKIDLYRDSIKYAKRRGMSEFELSNEDKLSRILNKNKDISKKFNDFVNESQILTQEASLIIANSEEGSVEDFFKLLQKKICETNNREKYL